MALLNHLLRLSEEEPLLFYDGFWVRACDLQKMVYATRSAYSSLKGKPIAIRGESDFETVKLIIAFDGFARCLLLIGEGVSEDQCERFKESCGVSAQVVTRSVNFPIKDKPKINSELETDWIIPTSGTTSIPKLVKHSLTSLSKTVRTDRTKGERLVWGMVYDATRFAGIQVLLQAILGGSRLVLVPDRKDLKGMLSSFQRASVNALSATPTMWRKLAMSGFLDCLNLLFVTLGGEIVDQKLLSDLALKFPTARITSIYASTEVGVGFSVTDKIAGFPSTYLNEKLPGGVELKVYDNRLFIRKHELGSSYVNSDDPLEGADGWVDSGDLVELRGDRYIFLGRANGTINVGGQKVCPEEVESVIRELNDVGMVLVSARRNSFVGNVVEAFVVPKPDGCTEILKKEILLQCQTKLAPYKVPASIKFVDNLESTDAGKLHRR